MLYVLGKPVWNAQRLLAVVGSRNASAYGRSVVNAIIGDISGCLPVIVSGLASGIDAAAHQASLEHELITIAVMAHGLDMVYPYGHRRMAERILASGGALISEYPPGTKPDRYRFPARNRIIAGISDGVLVAESTSRGGGMITAGLADSYFREVFAVPGRIGDERSEGCNDLISGHLAHLVCSGRDLAAVLNWTGCIREATGDTDHLSGKAVLTAEEYSVLEKIRRHGPLHLEILAASGLSQRLSEILLRLEIDGLIRALPGPVYEC